MTALLVSMLLTQMGGESPGDEPPRLNVISVEVNGWNMAFSSTAISFEHALLPHLSIAGGLVAEDRKGWFQGWFHNFSALANGESRYTGGIRGLVRWYPQGAAPFGLWLGPMAAAAASGTSVAWADFPGGTDVHGLDVLLFTGGLLVGFSGMLPFGAVFQVSGGIRADWARVRMVSQDSSGAYFQTTYKRFAVSPITYVGVGWAF